MKWWKHYPLNKAIRIIYVKCLAHYRPPIKYGGGIGGNDGGDASDGGSDANGNGGGNDDEG